MRVKRKRVGGEGSLVVKYLVYFTLCLLSSSAFGFNATDTLEVTTSALNLRSEPNVNSESIIKLKEGEMLIVERDLGEWVQVSFAKHNGFVSSEYVKKVGPLGFYDWFKNGWFYGSLVLFLIFFAGKAAALRVKDQRFSSGYREGVVGGGELIKAMMSAGVMGLLIGFGYAIYMWVSN